jgi:hypothetical protein
MKKVSAVYVTVRIDVEHDENVNDIDDVFDYVVSEMDYDIQYKDASVEIVDTEICGINQEY